MTLPKSLILTSVTQLVVERGQDVGRLDVAVDQALAEDVAQRHRALEADLHHLLQRQQRVGAAVAAAACTPGRTPSPGRAPRRRPPRRRSAPRWGAAAGPPAPPRRQRSAAGSAPSGVSAPAPRRTRLMATSRSWKSSWREEDLAGRALAQLGAHRVLADLRRQLGARRAGGGTGGAWTGMAHAGAAGRAPARMVHGQRVRRAAANSEQSGIRHGLRAAARRAARGAKSRIAR